MKTVVVARFGGSTKGVTATNPRVGNESSDAQLIAHGSQQCSHSRGGAKSRHGVGIVIVGVDGLGAHIETLQGHLRVVARHKKFVAIAQSESQRVVVILVVTHTNKAGTQLATLLQTGEGTFVRDFGTAA